MNKFGKGSWRKLNSGVHAKLIALATLVAKKRDISITSGRRGKDEQNDFFDDGFSKLRFPHSAHNTTPSRAIDATPYPCEWDDLESFELMRKDFYVCADSLGIKLKLIIKFDDGTFDYPHIELDNNEI